MYKQYIYLKLPIVYHGVVFSYFVKFLNLLKSFYGIVWNFLSPFFLWIWLTCLIKIVNVESRFNLVNLCKKVITTLIILLAWLTRETQSESGLSVNFIKEIDLNWFLRTNEGKNLAKNVLIVLGILWFRVYNIEFKFKTRYFSSLL